MVIDMYDRVYNNVKNALNGAIDGLNIQVHKKVPNNKITYPIVVITEKTNAFSTSTLNREEQIDRLMYEIEIYSTDLPINGTMTSSLDVCREIQLHIDDILGKQMGMKRTGCSPIPNIDTTIYRVLMVYSTKINTYRQNLI